jgi:hypothetical protein
MCRLSMMERGNSARAELFLHLSLAPKRLTPRRVAAGTLQDAGGVSSCVYVTVVLFRCVINFGFTFGSFTGNECTHSTGNLILS